MRRDHGFGFEKGKVLGQTPQHLESTGPISRVHPGREASPAQGQDQGQCPTVADAIRVAREIE